MDPEATTTLPPMARPPGEVFSGCRRAAAVAALFVSSAALAFVMPSFSILRHMTSVRDDLALYAVRIDGLASFHGSAVKEVGGALGLPTDRPEILTDASFALKLPGRCRLDFTPLEGNRAAQVESYGKRRTEGSPVAIAQAALGPVCALLAVRSSSEGEARAAVERYLELQKVDRASRTWLARFGGDVAYVIGSRDDTRPQLWVFKDNFLPARMRWADEQGVAWDVRFYDYTSPATGEWFPRLLEVQRNGELVLRFTSLKADTKSPLSDKLF